jgi:ribosomal-protein-alanine N-acetyltransferase
MQKLLPQSAASLVDVASAAATGPVTAPWQAGLPRLIGSLVSIRELRLTDAPALFTELTAEDVSRLISPPPASIPGFEQFIAWTQRQRQAGLSIGVAVVPKESDDAVGLFQVRSLDPTFDTAEWGFALGAEFWGTGAFLDSAKLVLDVAFDVIGVHRLEARAAHKNGRGNGALQKLGATHEGVLRRSFLRNGEYLDQALWTILAEDRRRAKAAWLERVIH